MAAGRAVGCWDVENVSVESNCTSFKPKISDDERDMRYSKWKMAVERSFGWESNSMV